ncbi:hypothetical protein C6N75_19910 [Streptomyces solincola]|uniref:Uncharacterized protein n=1 Tax=Streptomyces solincola TaxID=2100817 RepID=A0A2S9PT47_9ACTN|nr:hypothetical protein [Streptomyces solincola]PRH77507.1 hypothetical protein C6N75_19910 [Streptomyces solincola]
MSEKTAPDAAGASGQWREITVSLAVTKPGLSPSAVEQTLSGIRFADTGAGGSVHTGPNWWAYSVDPRRPDGLEGSVTALVADVSLALDGLRALVHQGHTVQIAVSGVVEPGPEWWLPWTQLTLSPRSAAQLATLDLPVSFTVLTPDNEPAEDPLAWLD